MRKRNIDVRKLIITFVIAVIGGTLFHLIHIPVPWLLGPMITIVLTKNILKWEFKWQDSLRDTGMIVVGYMIGLSMTSTALHEISRQLPSMLLMTILLIIWCAGIASILSRFAKIDYPSALLGSIPGGLTQVILLAEETKGVNLALVTITQVVRLMIIIASMPLLVMLPIFRENSDATLSTITISQTVEMFPTIIVFAVVCVTLAVIGSKIKFPTAYLLGPIIGTSLLQLGGMLGPELPVWVLNLAQLMIGTHIGLMLDTRQITNKGRLLGLAIITGFLLLIGSILLSVVLTFMHDMSAATALLSLAPGGMDQMGIIAHEIKAELSTVSGYQIFRVFFIFFAVPPMVKLLFRMLERYKTSGKKVSHSE